jgi:hypothetical protein
LRLTRVLLPPRPKPRGRPRNQQTTRAILLYSRFRRQHPEEKPRETWSRVCGVLFSEYAEIGPIRQHDMRQDLQERVRSRLRKRHRRRNAPTKQLASASPAD